MKNSKFKAQNAKWKVQRKESGVQSEGIVCFVWEGENAEDHC
jgi:hypothetical protein